MTATDDLNLSPSDRLALEELRRRISNDLDQKVYDETFFLYRFLKARNFNVDQAEHMLRKNLEWRKQGQIDSIPEYNFPKVMQEYLSDFNIGFDKDGSPVFYIPIGKLDARGLMMSAKVSDLEKYAVYILEVSEKLLERQSKKLLKRLPGSLFIYDAAELSFASASDKKAIDILIRVLKVLQDNYPERLKNIIVINSSTMFSIGFSVMKNCMASSILQKLFIYDSDGWKEELLRRIDENQLPAFLGGLKTDSDGNPLCLKTVNHCGKIDEKYYIARSKKSLASNPKAKKLVISRASFSEIILDVEEPGSFIEWEFETKTRDVGFGLFFRETFDKEEKVTELVPLQRLDTDVFAETGIYKCEKAGTYVMLFDNSYSWMRSKEIYYTTKIVNPKEHTKHANLTN